MPNHCSNKMTLIGSSEDLKQFVEFSKKGENAFDIEKFIPMPEELHNTSSPNRNKENAVEMVKKYGAMDWYDWAVKNWGTKWGAYNVEVNTDCIEDEVLTYYFRTAWGPFNENVISVMSEKFPGIAFELKFAEMGMGFWGKVNAMDGAILESRSGDVDINYTHDPDESDDFEVEYKFDGIDEDFVYLLSTSG